MNSENSSAENAQDKAIRYVNQYGWKIKQIVDVQKLPSEPLLDQDKHKVAALRHAEQVGINAEIDAWQKAHRPGNYSVESLRKPPKK